MKYSILFAIGLAMILPLQAAGKGGKAKQGGKANPETIFKRLDKDGDGALTKEEFAAKAKDASKAATRFAKLDKNSDGKLTLAEIKDRKSGKKAGGKKAGKKAGKRQGNKGGKKGGNKGGKKANGADTNK